MEYVIHILILYCIYLILGVSLNLITGYAGLITLAHAGYFGIGAYVIAILSTSTNMPAALNILIAVLFCIIVCVVVAIPTLRIRDDYFAIATFMLHIIIYNIFNNWISVTGGPMGITEIQNLSFGFVNLYSTFSYFVVIFVVCIISLAIMRRICLSPYGKVLKGIREDELLLRSFGINVNKYKISVFIVGSSFASLAGALYAYYVGFVSPPAFTFMESVYILAIIIIGGAGNFWSPILGALVMVLFPEIFRFIGLPNSIVANLRQILLGVAIILFLVYRPKGILGENIFAKTGKLE
ncbi:MAG: branched-chain amino acid ABC transporter permease [candidate division Zixibacteria bacterium]|nr:branched-chain amino acid ABC transporter permease [candidate division Zixibacteria bacterium]